MNKKQLANKIWASANKMRSKIEANEYKDYILGFIFYKFLSDKELSYLKVANGNMELSAEDLEGITEDDAETVAYLQDNLGYFISYENLFSTWITKGKSFSVANVRDALSAFDRKISTNHKKLFDGIFGTLQTGLSKLGSTDGEQSAAIRDLISLIREIPTDGRQDYDVLGFVYEYLISNFAANAGKKAGEFYTPHEVSLMMSDIIAHHLRHQDEIRIYDPTSGSGSLLINIGKSVARHINNKDNIKYYAQELKQNTFNLTRMNLIMRGINPSNIEVRNGDTLLEDWPYFDETDPQGTYEPLYVDAVVSNPPYSQEWNPQDQETDPRYAEFGLAPKKCADFAFLLHDLYHVKPRGIMTIVLPHGVLYRGGSEYEIRKHLVEFNHIDAIIGLPEKVFFGTGISTIVMVLKRPDTRNGKTDILFIDASNGFAKEGKNNKLRACDIKKIVDAVTTRTETPDYAQLVEREVIRSNDYNLNISRYVDGSSKPEKYDIYATMFGGIPAHELNRLNAYWKTFPTLRNKLFHVNADGYNHLAVDNVSNTIEQDHSVLKYVETFRQKFETKTTTLPINDTQTLQHEYMVAESMPVYSRSNNISFSDYLNQKLVVPMLSLNITQTKAEITTELFHRLETLPLVDKYQAFQFFSDNWEQITTDIEILQTEGIDAVRAVDPNMVWKNDKEVQEGWIGRILPFALVQKILLAEQVTEVETLQRRLAEISDEYGQLLETLSEEEKEQSYVNEDGTKWVNAEVKKQVKPLIAINKTTPLESDSIENKLIKVSLLIDEEKSKKKELKQKQELLLDDTIASIKQIDDTTATNLLRTKWIEPLVSSIERMPNEVVQELESKVHQLTAKYATTYQDIANRIATSESKLYHLIGELIGNEVDALGLTAFRDTLTKE